MSVERHHSAYDGTLARASQEMLWNAWPSTAMHSVGESASSWWIALMPGLIAASMSTPTWPASTRGPALSSAGVGGGTESPDSQRSSARLAGSRSRRFESSVVPARNRPTTMTGASTGVARSSGCSFRWSTTRSRLTSAPVTAPWTAMPPSSLRSRLGLARLEVRREAGHRQVAVLAEVVEAGLLARPGQQLVGVHAPTRDDGTADWCVRPRGQPARHRPPPCRSAARCRAGPRPSATSSSSAACTRSACLRRERVDAELPEPARRVEVREEDAHHREVEHRGLAQRPASEAGLRVVVEPDGEVAAAPSGAGPDRLGLLTPDRVEDDVGAAVGRVVHDRVEHVVLAVVEHHVGAEIAADLALVRSTGGGDHAGAGRLGELDRGGADGAGPAPDQDGLTRLQPGPVVESEVGDVERQGERGRLLVVELGRRREDVARAPRARPGRRATARRCRRPARRPGLEPLARRLDHPGHVHAQRERRLGRHRRDGASTSGDVAEVEGPGRHPDPHLARARLRRLRVANLHDVLGLTERADPHCPHAVPPQEWADRTKRALYRQWSSSSRVGATSIGAAICTTLPTNRSVGSWGRPCSLAGPVALLRRG